MQITDVTIRKFMDEERLKAIVSVTFDDMFVVHDIKVIQGEKGLFLSMPNKKFGQNEFKDVAHPTNSEMRSIMEESVFAAYEAKKQEALETEM